MSIDAYYTETFTPYTVAQSATFPYDSTATAGTAFKGALDTVGSAERWAGAAIVAQSTHWIACPASVTLTQGMRIGYGTRTFEVVGVPDPVTLKASHHQEVFVKEIT